VESSTVPTKAGIIGRNKISRKGHRGRFSLHLGNAQKPLTEVVPDAVHSGMFRVVLPSGHLSDMVNLTWAMDAAVAIALSILNKNQGQERLTAAPPIAQDGEGVPHPRSGRKATRSSGDRDA
jgi:hypothetical protein